jgi:hypothetical protein
MNQLYHFERLKEWAGLITGHPDFPGKAAVIEQCAEDIDGLVRSGRITGEQGGMLQDLLAGVNPREQHVSLSRNSYGPGSAASPMGDSLS